MFTIYDLPALNAFLNASSTVCLLSGFYFIRRRMIKAHKRAMISAFLISVLFLISYLIYHYHVGSVRFSGEGGIRVLYFAILISHSILAAIIPPLAIITLRRGLKERFEKHVALARWTLPIWLYVSVTGVIIYLMLYQLYPPNK